MNRILLLEDDHIIAKEIKDYLHQKDIVCDVVYDGALFFKQLKLQVYDVFLLDINVPHVNGLDICKQIRETDKLSPILMITAFGEIEDKIQAFALGADDYLVKPFHLDELYIRIQALLRRKNSPQQSHANFELDDLKIDFDQKLVTRNNKEIKLTPKEYKLLCILAKANGRILSKQQIADQLWDYQIETNENTIEVYMNFLRNKIDKLASVKLLHTKVGFGYYLKSEA